MRFSLLMGRTPESFPTSRVSHPSEKGTRSWLIQGEFQGIWPLSKCHCSVSGKNVFVGVMDISAALLGMPVRRQLVTPLPTKAKRSLFSHEAEDLVVFSPHLYKGCFLCRNKQAAARKTLL